MRSSDIIASFWPAHKAKKAAEDLDLVPTYVMRDNDTKFTAQFDAVIEALQGL